RCQRRDVRCFFLTPGSAPGPATPQLRSRSVRKLHRRVILAATAKGPPIRRVRRLATTISEHATAPENGPKSHVLVPGHSPPRPNFQPGVPTSAAALVSVMSYAGASGLAVGSFFGAGLVGSGLGSGLGAGLSAGLSAGFAASFLSSGLGSGFG